jgi:hypothetical protein
LADSVENVFEQVWQLGLERKSRSYANFRAADKPNRWQILRSNADFKTAHVFSHSLDPLQPLMDCLKFPSVTRQLSLLLKYLTHPTGQVECKWGVSRRNYQRTSLRRVGASAVPRCDFHVRKKWKLPHADQSVCPCSKVEQEQLNT